LEKQICDKEFFISRLFGQFLAYFNRHSSVLAKRLKLDSKDFSLELKLNISDDKNEHKVAKAVDKLMDNVRIFACFMADLCIYYYNLDNLMFLCQTATEDHVAIGQNPFLTSDLLANYFIDIIFRSDTTCAISELVKFQSRDQTELLAGHISLIKRVGNWSDIGLPQELLRDNMESFMADEAKAKDNMIMNESEIKDFFGTSLIMETEEDLSPRREECKMEKQDSTHAETNCKNSKNQSEEKAEALGEPCPVSTERSEEDTSHLTFIQDDPKLKLVGASFSILKECTFIESCPQGGINDMTSNETQGNILALLHLKEEMNHKKDRILFPHAIEIFRQLPNVANPVQKLYLLATSVVCALQEMRQIYSEHNPDIEVKFKVTVEMIVSVLIYIILKADVSDLIAEYKIMKVYFLLDKEYNHNKLIYLLKSAIKSINKLGVYHTRHSV
jgi:hypothetical protein